MHKYLIILISLLLGRAVALSAPAEQQWVDSLYAEADTYYANSDYVRSMELLQQIMPVVEKAEYTDEDRATCYSLASVLNLRMGDFDQAIDYAEKTLVIDRASGIKEDISSSLNTIAGIYQAADQPEKALSYELEANKYVTEEVWTTYGHHKSFGGWYISTEISRKTRGCIETFHEMGRMC